MRTCKWCGKQFDYSPFSRGSRSTEYCCGRCYNAAMHEEQRERQRNKEEAEKFEKDHPLLSSIFKFLIIGYFAVLLILGAVKKRGNNEQKSTEAAQETVVTQSSFKENSIVQSVKQQEIERVTEDLTMDYNIVVDGIEEDFAEESEIEEEIEEEIVENHGVVIVEEEDFSHQKIYDIVEEMPAFPGGDYELIKYIDENLNYPQDAMESGIQGRVFVKLIVEPNGSISNAKIIRGLGYGCDEEAIRVIESMPNWKPGRKNGVTVRVNIAVPVNFKLQ